jgi:hypothetical protein
MLYEYGSLCQRIKIFCFFITSRSYNVAFLKRYRFLHLIAYITPIDMNDPFNKAMLSVDTEQQESHEKSPRVMNMPEHADRIPILKALGLKRDNPNLTEELFS